MKEAKFKVTKIKVEVVKFDWDFVGNILNETNLFIPFYHSSNSMSSIGEFYLIHKLLNSMRETFFKRSKQN